MLEPIAGLPEPLKGLHLGGTLSPNEVEFVMRPLFERARTEGKRFRLLVEVDASYRGVSAGAFWEELKLGVHHLRRIERAAVVSDVDWVRAGVLAKSLFSPLFDCPIRLFHESEREEAIAWLGETNEHLGQPVFRLLKDEGVLVLEPKAPLRKEDIEAIAAAVDPWLESHGVLRGLVVRVHKFPGWESLGALVKHFEFVRDHQRQVPRIAFASDSHIANIVENFARQFLSAEVKRFEFDEYGRAVEWAVHGVDTPAASDGRPAYAPS